ncbi:pentapeptide repeat-containing protein [Paucilactobacillus nenjiangensis]|uniref:pentapeptide repeat-containing protein n=1 Tax=Paucilactobacillus nenjiangensis TaxID=1296540 RepID=UPI0010F5A04E|nr:pentapeptide repeat-containing protein [Paucilactobacillus nenjiangensis]
MNQATVDKMIVEHEQWLDDHETGTRADFSNLDLSSNSFAYHDLSYAIFNGANLSRADFEDDILNGTSFVGAIMIATDLSYAAMFGTDFQYAELTNAFVDDIYGAVVDFRHCQIDDFEEISQHISDARFDDEV